MRGAEVTVSDRAGAQWRKSSYSGGSNDCVELAVARSGAAVRDSKNTATGHLAFQANRWHAFLGIVKEGRLDSR
jgi:hypothetical protein